MEHARNLSAMRTTPWRPFTDKPFPLVRATYGFHYIYGNSAPYFSLTGDIKEHANQRPQDYSGGSCHDSIVAAFPELADLVPWHLVDQNGLPMHYIANAVYWFEQIGKPKQNSWDADPETAFKNTVVFGAVNLDTMPELGNVSACKDWLVARVIPLRDAFLAAMARHDVALIPGRLHREEGFDGTRPKLIRQWWAE